MGLAQHMRRAREAKALGRRNRLCPDRRDGGEAREAAMVRVRLKAALGLGAFSREGP